MKKQVKKLSLNKKTISNLTTAEMSKHVGGNTGERTCGDCPKGTTVHGNTCYLHKTCS